MTNISNNDIAQAIYLASKDQSQDKQFLLKVVQFLDRKRLLSKAPAILASLDKITGECEGVVVAKVSSAEVIDDKTDKKISEILIKRYAAKTVKLVKNLDSKLIGGFKIEAKDEVMDFTLRNQIRKLQEHLTKGA